MGGLGRNEGAGGTGPGYTRGTWLGGSAGGMVEGRCCPWVGSPGLGDQGIPGCHPALPPWAQGPLPSVR